MKDLQTQLSAINAQLSAANVKIGKNPTIYNEGGSAAHGSIAIGESAYSYVTGSNLDKYFDFGMGAVGSGGFLGLQAVVKDASKLPASIVIGRYAIARSGSVMLGDHFYEGDMGDRTVTKAAGNNAYYFYNANVYSTTLGSNSHNSGALAAVTGAFSIVSGKYQGSGIQSIQNIGATIYGSLNSIESYTSDSLS